MSQDQTQEQSAAGLNEPGSVLSAKEDDFDILKAGYEELSARYATLLNERDILKAELDKLQLAIKQLIRARYSPSEWTRSSSSSPWKASSRTLGRSPPPRSRLKPRPGRRAARRRATTCRPIWSATRSLSTSPTRPARAAAARCT